MQTSLAWYASSLSLPKDEHVEVQLSQKSWNRSEEMNFTEKDLNKKWAVKWVSLTPSTSLNAQPPSHNHKYPQHVQPHVSIWPLHFHRWRNFQSSAIYRRNSLSWCSRSLAISIALELKSWRLRIDLSKAWRLDRIDDKENDLVRRLGRLRSLRDWEMRVEVWERSREIEGKRWLMGSRSSVQQERDRNKLILQKRSEGLNSKNFC